MEEQEARRLFAAAPVARLASADGEGRPHVVPICFAVEGERIYMAVDHKPKRTMRLRRLANIRANPAVSALADLYSDDWSRLWWARADGTAVVVDPGTDEHGRAVDLLATHYEQYRSNPPAGPAIVISVSRWSGWSAAQG
jgi:PPOX class probable F420-dependent enzyme